MDFQKTWQALTAYSLTAVVIPTTFAGYTWRCTTAGTSGATDPFIGNDPSLNPTVTDGTVTWSVGTGFRQAFHEALSEQVGEIIRTFASANPTLIRSIKTTRPPSLTNEAKPCFFFGDIAEQAVHMNGIRQRQLTAEGFVVNQPGDSFTPDDQFNFLVDVLADLFTTNYHAINGRSIFQYEGVSDTEFVEGTIILPAIRFEFSATVMEGRN